MAAEFEGGSRSRAILAAIVADPAFGPAALSRPATLFGLLTEYLPDSPGQTGPLLAAAQVDVPEALRRRIAAGIPHATAIRLAANRVAARTGLPEEACLWATCEFALALGLITIDELSESLLDGDFDQAGPVERAPAGRTGTELLPGFDGPRQRGSASPRLGRPPGRGRWLAAIGGAVVVTAGVTGIFLFSQHLAGQQPNRSHSHGNPGARIASPLPRSPGPSHVKASAHPGVPDASASPGTASPAPPSPVPVARAYIADVNARDWPSLWRLGGGNVVLTYQPDPGPLTYPEMVAAFQHTVSVTITSLTSAGDTVSMDVSAVDSAGVTQYYQLNLVIGSGRVVSGSQYFLGP
jgi:hypothetical protein